MNDKQIRRLFAEIDEIKKRISVLEDEKIAKQQKPPDPFPRNQYPWSSFEMDLVAEKLNVLIKEMSLKIGRSPAQVGGRMINYLKKDF